MLTLLRRVTDFVWKRNMRRTIRLLRRMKAVFFKMDSPETTINVSQLENKLGFLQNIMNKRPTLSILEIGPKTGTHSLFIERFFKPASLTFLERPSKDREDYISKWIHKIKCDHKIIYSDLLMAKELEKEKFDIIFCLGVIYHNVEYFKIFNFLRRLLKDDGYLVLGTVLSYDRRSSIIINYREGQLYDLSRPSKKAIKTILEMTGFDGVKSFNLPFPNQRGLFVYKKGEKVPAPPGSCDFGGSIV